MLHDEMKGRVHFEQDSVWTQLKVDEVEVDLVKACCQQLEITCKNDIDSLKWIVDPHTLETRRQKCILFSYVLISSC